MTKVRDFDRSAAVVTPARSARRWIGLAFCLTLLAPAPPVTAGSPLPTFSKAFEPGTIGPGSTSTLRFDITNPDTAPVSDLAFVDNLPASVTIADPANAVSDCTEAILSAPPGGGTITFSDAILGSASSCFVRVDVTSASPGTHNNMSGDLTSSAGNSGPAVADLIVDAERPGFTKAFAPDPIVEGDSSTLTFTIDNSLASAAANFISFIDNLPTGLVVAAPANAATDCDSGLSTPTLTAVSGSTTITLTNGSVAVGSACTVSVDVAAESAGLKGNTTEELTSTPDFANFPSSGKASATLEVTRPFLRKLFTDDPVPPGEPVTLEFTLTNLDRDQGATDISFTDDLSAALAGLVATGLPLDDPCGAGSQLAGTSLLSFIGGSLPPGGSCTFQVTLAVPAAAVPGSYVNTTSSVSFDLGGAPASEDPASDDLVVAPVPTLTKSFVNDPVTGGDTVLLSFSVTNSSATASATDVAFEDILFDGLPTAAATPGPDPCGAGSSATFTPPSGFAPARIDLVGGSLAAAGSCTFDFTLDVDESLATGNYLNMTGPITATVDGVPLTGAPASDFLVVVSAPRLVKDFTDDPVLPGGQVTLEFTLELPVEAPGNATAIAFTDDLGAVLTGLEAVGLPASDICGTGSQLSGTSLLSFTGGSLSPGGSCTFSATLVVPSGVLPGDLTNTTSGVTAMSLGLPVTSDPASADLRIGGLTLGKTFTDDPVLAGDTVTLEFTLDNLSPTASATDMTFSDDLDDALGGLVALGLPIADPCGAGSSLSGFAGDSFLLLAGGLLAPLTGCTFDVTLQVPAGAEVGDYLNTTSQLSADVGGSPVVIDGASDVLSVFEPLSLAKLFVDDPVPPGGTVSLQFTLTNVAAQAVTGIGFTDDLEAVLSGLAAVGLPADDVCGAGSQISGTSLLSFTGGSLGPDESCSFTVDVAVPGGVATPTTVTNTTSEVTGTLGALVTSGDPASDELTVAEAICTAADGENLTLSGDSVTDFQSYEVCGTIEVGPNYGVLGPNGFLVLRAGEQVILSDGAFFGIDARATIGIDPSLKP